MADKPRKRLYGGAIPVIAQAYQNDPRTRLSNTMLGAGMSGAPVAAGGWGVPDGLARAAQAMAGAFIAKKLGQESAGRDEEYRKELLKLTGGTDEMSAAAQALTVPQGMVSTPPIAPTPATLNPATTNPAISPIDAAATALAPVAPRPQPAPIQAFDPGPSSAAQAGLGAPPAPVSNIPGVSPAPLAPAAPVVPPRRPFNPAPRRAPAFGPAPDGKPHIQQYSARDYYYKGIVPIEGGTDRSGRFLTSPKGAVGPGQIMPGTAPEAAKLAGLPWDARRYRSDPEYNNALGEAYYAKQLQTFGDPVKAAAAYNAGPGGVRRAMRRAARHGGSYQQYLPAETRKYLSNFKVTIGGNITNREDIEAMGPTETSTTAIPEPQYEEIPAGPPAPGPRPDAPKLPDEVPTQRIALARQLLQSGNPDMVALAQSYLEKGLEEQYDARTLRAQQEFTRGNIGYTSDLQDYNQAQSDFRGDAYTRRREAAARNFSRESDYANRQFQAGESAAEREFRAGESAAERDFRAKQASQEQWNANWRVAYGEEKQDQRAARPTRNPALDTIKGQELQIKMGDEINAIEAKIHRAQRFKELNNKQHTGGVYGVPGIGDIASGVADAFDDELDEMSKYGAQMTIDMAPGGSLGAQVSNSDREVFERAGPNLGSRNKANNIIADTYIAAQTRLKDYKLHMLDAFANQNVNQFVQEWAQYVQSTPFVTKNRKGDPVFNPRTPTFEQWRNAPRYDRRGNRIN